MMRLRTKKERLLRTLEKMCASLIFAENRGGGSTCFIASHSQWGNRNENWKMNDAKSSLDNPDWFVITTSASSLYISLSFSIESTLNASLSNSAHNDSSRTSSPTTPILDPPCVEVGKRHVEMSIQKLSTIDWMILNESEDSARHVSFNAWP